MGLRDYVTQPYVEAQERVDNALNLEARATEFEERVEALAARVQAAERKASAAVEMADSIVQRHSDLVAKLEALVTLKAGVRKELLRQLVKEEVGRINYAELRRAADANDPFPIRMLSPAVSASSYPDTLGSPGMGFGWVR